MCRFKRKSKYYIVIMNQIIKLNLKNFIKDNIKLVLIQKYKNYVKGELSDNIWVYQSLRNTFDDSQTIAQRLSSVPDVILIHLMLKQSPLLQVQVI